MHKPGWGAATDDCSCSLGMVQRYRKRISDLLVDRRDGPWACGSASTCDLSFRTLSVFVTTGLDSQRIVHYGLTSNLTDAWWLSSCGM